MNYKQTIDWLYAQLPVFQNIGALAYKNDLSNTLKLTKHLGNPERGLVCIHVAGTNGKGSTSHLLAAILQDAGYKVGLYTSPHLKDFRERIKINGVEISKKYISDFVFQNKPFLEQNHLSFFEMTVGLAFEYFKNQKTDINIIEVGMGGRLDSTNVITPKISVITNISLDHTQFLGNTLAKIASEKAGIIKPNIPIVIGEYTKESKTVFEKVATQNTAPLFFASHLEESEIECALLGDYQTFNKKTVLQTIRVLQSQKQFVISESNIQNGFLNVIKTTGLYGRWQQMGQMPLVICDTAHNKDGLKIVLKQIQKQTFDRLHIVLGFVNDKDLSQILPLFPKKALYYFAKPNIQRGLEAKKLQQMAREFLLVGDTYISVSAAYEAALQNASMLDFVFVGGSTFVVGEIL